MKLVLLPGMDGTGNLFYPLLQELPLSLDVKVITFSSRSKQSYIELLLEIKKQLPKSPFTLVAESFSGVLAYRLALDKEVPIQKLILIATFLESPRPKLLRIIRFLPLSFVFSLPLPSLLYEIFCFGNRGGMKLVNVLKKSLSQVKGEILSHRLRLMSDMELCHKDVTVKTLILNPLNDRLVPKRVSDRVSTRFINSVVKGVDGPHFLAQVSAKDIAALILEFVHEPSSR